MYFEVQDTLKFVLLTKCIKIFNNEWKSVCAPRGSLLSCRCVMKCPDCHALSKNLRPWGSLSKIYKLLPKRAIVFGPSIVSYKGSVSWSNFCLAYFWHASGAKNTAILSDIAFEHVPQSL